MIGLIALALTSLLSAYLWHASRALYYPPPEAAKLASKRWTKDEIFEAYRKTEKPQQDTTPLLPRRHGRRYIIVGGSGLVGGWITTHLLQRGESASAIRILDLQPPKQPRLAASPIRYVNTDITSPDAVEAAFKVPWDRSVASKPLTVFHCVAYIRASDRYSPFLAPYMRVNVEGARNILFAARAADCTAFVATSSASISIQPPSLFAWPWQSHPRRHFQMHSNADPAPNYQSAPLSAFGSCYAFSKAQMEYLILSLNTPDLPTGCIRPGHAIYGTGVQNPNSLSYDYLRRGGNPTWIAEIVTQFVDAQNVSAAHLALEEKLVNPTTRDKVSGQAYCVTDPNPPVTYQHLYDVLATLAHPKTPVKFAYVSGMPLLLTSYVLEAYEIARVLWPGMGWLPALKGDAAALQPAIFNMSTLNVVYDDTRAREELGYKGVIGTLEGMCRAVREWNERVDLKDRMMTDGNAEKLQDEKESVVPPVKM